MGSLYWLWVEAPTHESSALKEDSVSRTAWSPLLERQAGHLSPLESQNAGWFPPSFLKGKPEGLGKVHLPMTTNQQITVHIFRFASVKSSMK